MAKILLINAPVREFAKPNNPPLGPLYIAAYLEKHGHQCDICDLNALRAINPVGEHWLDMFEADYDVIGLSGLVTTYEAQLRILAYLVANRDFFGNPKLIAGGGLPSSAPEFTLKHFEELDAIVVGEGEITALEIAAGNPLPQIPGVRTCADEPEQLRRELIPHLDDLPFPDFSKVPVDVYLKNPVWGIDARNSSGIRYQAKRSLSMIVSRGCPYSCGFCFHDVFGKKYRTRSPENVIAEMTELKEKYEIDFVGFLDDNTIANREWAIDFCGKLVEADLGLHWGCHARVDEVDAESLKLMRESGCEFIGFGVESANPDILTAMNKKIDPAQAAEALRLVRAAGIYANATFIAGYPGETIDTLRDTARFMKDNDCLGSMFFAAPYPGTELYEQSKERILKHYVSLDHYIMSLGDATEFRVNLSDMSDSDLYLYQQMAIGGIPF